MACTQQRGSVVAARDPEGATWCRRWSWAAKGGLAMPIPRLLDHHVKHKDSSVVTYSRDAMAEPLRQLHGVLKSVADGSFFPDRTRSKRFVTKHQWRSDPRGMTMTRTRQRFSMPSRCCAIVGLERARPSQARVELVKKSSTGGVHFWRGSGTLECAEKVPKTAPRCPKLDLEGTMCLRCVRFTTKVGHGEDVISKVFRFFVPP